MLFFFFYSYHIRFPLGGFDTSLRVFLDKQEIDSFPLPFLFFSLDALHLYTYMYLPPPGPSSLPLSPVFQDKSSKQASYLQPHQHVISNPSSASHTHLHLAFPPFFPPSLTPWAPCTLPAGSTLRTPSSLPPACFRSLNPPRNRAHTTWQSQVHTPIPPRVPSSLCPPLHCCCY